MNNVALLLLKTWFRARKKLRWQPNTSTYPRDLTPRKLEFMLERYLSWSKADVILILKALKKARFTSGMNLQNAGGHRSSFVQLLTNAGAMSTPRDCRLAADLDQAFPPLMARDIHLHESDGWRGSDLHSTQADMLHTIDAGLADAKSNPASILLITAVLRQNWSERNQKQFRGITTSLPAAKLLAEINNEVRALEDTKGNADDWKESIMRAKTTIGRWETITTTITERQTPPVRLRITPSVTTMEAGNNSRSPIHANRHSSDQEALPRIAQHDISAMVDLLLGHYELRLQQEATWGSANHSTTRNRLDIPSGT
ncbi:hypothetical protein R1sor_020487 [Riccia sorocarpa]|uniref:Uncharacterized protein n=1 Tax=Riccia sorocarpa TaxID=122646 RepID=A0ABD3IFE6_9MARC